MSQKGFRKPRKPLSERSPLEPYWEVYERMDVPMPPRLYSVPWKVVRDMKRNRTVPPNMRKVDNTIYCCEQSRFRIQELDSDGSVRFLLVQMKYSNYPIMDLCGSAVIVPLHVYGPFLFGLHGFEWNKAPESHSFRWTYRTVRVNDKIRKIMDLGKLFLSGRVDVDFLLVASRAGTECFFVQGIVPYEKGYEYSVTGEVTVSLTSALVGGLTRNHEEAMHVGFVPVEALKVIRAYDAAWGVFDSKEFDGVKKDKKRDGIKDGKNSKEKPSLLTPGIAEKSRSQSVKKKDIKNLVDILTEKLTRELLEGTVLNEPPETSEEEKIDGDEEENNDEETENEEEEPLIPIQFEKIEKTPASTMPGDLKEKESLEKKGDMIKLESTTVIPKDDMEKGTKKTGESTTPGEGKK